MKSAAVSETQKHGNRIFSKDTAALFMKHKDMVTGSSLKILLHSL
jgi:hypothetical protein